MPSARWKMIEDQMRRFADLPPEVFFKEELLRHGLSLGPLAAPDGSYQKKSYFIFSFDRTPIGQMPQQENRRAPESVFALLPGDGRRRHRAAPRRRINLPGRVPSRAGALPPDAAQRKARLGDC